MENFNRSSAPFQSKIFLIIPTLKQGGAERVMSELANELAIEGNAISLVLLAKAEMFYKLENNISVINLGFENKGRLSKIFSQFKVYKKLRALLKAQHPDFVLSFMTKYNVLTLLAAKGLETKVFISDRSNPKKDIGQSLKFLRKNIYRKATGIIAQTQLAKEILFKETGNNNIKVIPNPIRKIQSYPHIEKENLVINIGRMVPEKGQKFLLEAFSKIKNNSWKLVILGDGPLKEQLKEQADFLGISDRLILPGSVNNVDVWLSRSRIFAFSSISEGFPNALIEAMAAGLPCVSFDCDAGPRDLIKDGVNGYLVPLFNVNRLSIQISKLCADSDLREIMGLNASMVKEDLKINKITKKYLQFFKA